MILLLGARKIAIKLATICFNKDFLSAIKIETLLLGYIFLKHSLKRSVFIF